MTDFIPAGDPAPTNPVEAELAPISINKSDLGNARRFVALHGSKLRYVPKWGKWLVWDGTHWKPDSIGDVERRAKDVPRLIYAEAAKISNRDERRQMARWGLSTENSSRLANLVRTARSEPGIPVDPEQLDSDNFLLGCANGVFDLRTFDLLPHSPELLITKQIPVPFVPFAPCPTWRAFLKTITGGNESLEGFLRRAIGYSLTGDTREQCLFFMHGTGANGKSTFINTIKLLLGDYAKQTPTETLMKKDSGGINNDVAALKGARLIAAIETDEGERLAESFIKQITGGDVVAARFLYGEFFEFVPTFKVWLAGNHKPAVKGVDLGIWRRMRLIPFTVTIPDEQKDRQLPEKLKAELPGILQWAIDGCYEWAEGGLRPPPEVLVATEDYRMEMDIMGNFLNECCVVMPKAWATNADLYKRYTDWCTEVGEMAASQRKFTQRLAQRGFVQDRGTVRFWKGIGIKAA